MKDIIFNFQRFEAGVQEAEGKRGGIESQLNNSVIRQKLTKLRTYLASDSSVGDTEFEDGVRDGLWTFAMIRPNLDEIGKADGTDEEIADQILQIALENGFEPRVVLPVCLRDEEVRDFYYFLNKDILDNVVRLHTGGSVTLVFLYSQDGGASDKWRSLIGATDPREAQEGTIRQMFAKDLGNNVVHGSDSLEMVLVEKYWAIQVIDRLLEL